MHSFQHLLESMGWQACPDCHKYCSVGQTVCVQNEEIEGFYWYYETDQFIVDIHDFFVKKERMADSFPDLSHIMAFSSSYIKSANGECFHPYQTLTANTTFVTSMEKSDYRFLLHSHFPYLSVGVNFKEKMLERYLSDHLDAPRITVTDIFWDTRDRVTRPMEKLANAILNCSMDSPAAEIFLEAKAKEWLSVTLDAYFNKAGERKISESDEKAITDVANYINDHYALEISQGLLEKIAMMSGTKLKNVFKQKYQMSITEYIQRRRMNIAETLLSTTDLEVRDIARSVGYTSHSRFTTLFKKYKGIYPRDVKKLGHHSPDSLCDCPNSPGMHRAFPEEL
ncbi:helix-turn-helix transcriptional regulator [Eubacterium sp.]|uniref:helix-turn-helix transcriptional regulator n=1 Tax=Eubacterium sp. TaxID=142586 RepID=UPI002FCA6C30